MGNQQEKSIIWRETDDLRVWYKNSLKILSRVDRIVIDLAPIIYLDNLKLGFLVNLLSFARQQNKQITIINVPTQANRLLKAAKLEGKI